MRLPRDISGTTLVKAFRAVGYEVTRQTGSHIRLTRRDQGEHHVTVPNHDALKVGTLATFSATSPHICKSRATNCYPVSSDRET